MTDFGGLSVSATCTCSIYSTVVVYFLVGGASLDQPTWTGTGGRYLDKK